VTNAYEACKALPSNDDLYNGAAWHQEFKQFELWGFNGLEKMYYNNILIRDSLGSLINDPAKIMEL